MHESFHGLALLSLALLSLLTAGHLQLRSKTDKDTQTVLQIEACYNVIQFIT